MRKYITVVNVIKALGVLASIFLLIKYVIPNL